MAEDPRTRPSEDAQKPRPGEEAHKTKQSDVDVVLIRDWDVHKVGDVIKVPAEQAKSLVFHQVASEESGAVEAAKAKADEKAKAEAKAKEERQPQPLGTARRDASGQPTPQQ